MSEMWPVFYYSSGLNRKPIYISIKCIISYLFQSIYIVFINLLVLSEKGIALESGFIENSIGPEIEPCGTPSHIFP